VLTNVVGNFLKLIDVEFPQIYGRVDILKQFHSARFFEPCSRKQINVCCAIRQAGNPWISSGLHSGFPRPMQQAVRLKNCEQARIAKFRASQVSVHLTF
jgi:hypothetical protein